MLLALLSCHTILVGSRTLEAPKPWMQQGAVTGKSIDGLLKSLKSRDDESRKDAASKLIDLGPAAVAPLVAFINAETGEARVYAAMALANIDRANPLARKVLTNAVQESKGATLLFAAATLAERDPESDVTVAPLVREAEKFILIPTSKNVMNQRGAAMILGMTAPGIRALAKLLRHYDSWVREAAVFALDDRTETLGDAPASIREAVKECIPALVDVLADKDRIVREMANEDLVQIGTDEIPFLKKAVAGNNKKLSAAAAETLETIEKRVSHP